ncbi:RNA ligase RtcB family protein [Desulfoluna butyratoxydans]|uniref:3'-phosphate/5'-hydroxy nucleic acid ligase n=1 Tax=Desulfoluna butyratoxydans TaxID=231438 RepID=A0A4U8YTE8_9BACT|nr:RNA ligase RtcB family protein [Desulfoluna butyratoxydans]VFQ47221.1 trna-splicing ligase rtcb [Desulfoluna butyratoxydans]
MGTSETSAIIRVIASEKNWIEGAALQQLNTTATLPGMKLAIGLPDLHPGKGTPVGAAFFTLTTLYPFLIGNDIGCGMGLWQTDLKHTKIKRDRWVKKLTGLDAPWNGDPAPFLDEERLTQGEWDPALGTIGGGNHFAELQTVNTIEDDALFHKAGLSKDALMLLVHSGSRGLGESILRRHVAVYRNNGLEEGSEEAAAYLRQHDHALAWARVNRAVIAHRFLSALGTRGDRILDICHNSLTPQTIQGQVGWLHRKGAAPSDQGLVVIPGSRGSLSYLVFPTAPNEMHGFSLAHGAGRKWKRSESKGRLQNRYTLEALTQTALGSRVICKNRALLYEEAPQAYKNIDVVIQDMLEAGLITVVATLKPLITYKTREVQA